MTLPPDLSAALNEQHTHERENATLYAQMAYNLDMQAWPGFAHLFRQQAIEEYGHSDRIAEYMTDQGAPVVFQPVAIPAVMMTDPLGFMDAALKRETETTAALNQLYFFAEAQEHPQTCFFLQEMLKEQIEEEKKFSDLFLQVSRAGDNQAALWLIDAQFAKGE